MYSKDEATRLKQEFWTTLGQYLSLAYSSEGLRVNWINYKTGIKHLQFKMEADAKVARIGIEISHPDLGMQELLFEQFKEFRSILNGHIKEEWSWELHTADDYGRVVSRVSTSISSVSIFNKQDWPELISFLKPRIIALDAFWNDARDSFQLFQ